LITKTGEILMSRKQYLIRRTYIGRIPEGADLLESITKICKEEGIKIGKITAIGAVKKAVVAYYNQTEKKYYNHEFNKPMEILNCTGNVSLLNGQPFVHCHITLADEEGKCFGGHLMIGTVVFACEIFIEEYEGEILERVFDESSGLSLWHPGTILME
jgi:predicted DNA-binding protein with PD1-like motif